MIKASDFTGRSEYEMFSGEEMVCPRKDIVGNRFWKREYTDTDGLKYIVHFYELIWRRDILVEATFRKNQNDFRVSGFFESIESAENLFESIWFLAQCTHYR